MKQGRKESPRAWSSSFQIPSPSIRLCGLLALARSAASDFSRTRGNEISLSLPKSERKPKERDGGREGGNL